MEAMKGKFKEVIRGIFHRPEFPVSGTFVLEAGIGAIAKETPSRISGTVYFSRDFVTGENVERRKRKEIEKYGYVGSYELKTSAWRGMEDTYVSSVLEVIKNDPDFLKILY